jgi:hypothetical protein
LAVFLAHSSFFSSIALFYCFNAAVIPALTLFLMVSSEIEAKSFSISFNYSLDKLERSNSLLSDINYEPIVFLMVSSSINFIWFSITFAFSSTFSTSSCVY